jgi:hypothetical protein
MSLIQFNLSKMLLTTSLVSHECGVKINEAYEVMDYLWRRADCVLHMGLLSLMDILIFAGRCCHRTMPLNTCVIFSCMWNNSCIIIMC